MSLEIVIDYDYIDTNLPRMKLENILPVSYSFVIFNDRFASRNQMVLFHLGKLYSSNKVLVNTKRREREISELALKLMNKHSSDINYQFPILFRYNNSTLDLVSYISKYGTLVCPNNDYKGDYYYSFITKDDAPMVIFSYKSRDLYFLESGNPKYIKLFLQLVNEFTEINRPMLKLEYSGVRLLLTMTARRYGLTDVVNSASVKEFIDIIQKQISKIEFGHVLVNINQDELSEIILTEAVKNKEESVIFLSDVIANPTIINRIKEATTIRSDMGTFELVEGIKVLELFAEDGKLYVKIDKYEPNEIARAVEEFEKAIGIEPIVFSEGENNVS